VYSLFVLIFQVSKKQSKKK